MKIVLQIDKNILELSAFLETANCITQLLQKYPANINCFQTMCINYGIFSKEIEQSRKTNCIALDWLSLKNARGTFLGKQGKGIVGIF